MVTLDVWPTLLGCALVYLAKLWFLDRMVWLYEEMKTATRRVGPTGGAPLDPKFHLSYKKGGASFQADVKNKVFPWRVVPASNRRIWLAATLKGRYSISYADAFA